MSFLTGYQGNLNPSVTATIASSATDSAEIPLGGFTLAGIVLPATFTGTSISFKMATVSGGTYVQVKNASGLVSYPITQGTYCAIDPADFHGVAFLKVVSNATEGASRTLTLSLKGF